MVKERVERGHGPFDFALAIDIYVALSAHHLVNTGMAPDSAELAVYRQKAPSGPSDGLAWALDGERRLINHAIFETWSRASIEELDDLLESTLSFKVSQRDAIRRVLEQDHISPSLLRPIFTAASVYRREAISELPSVAAMRLLADVYDGAKSRRRPTPQGLLHSVGLDVDGASIRKFSERLGQLSEDPAQIGRRGPIRPEEKRTWETLWNNPSKQSLPFFGLRMRDLYDRLARDEKLLPDSEIHDTPEFDSVYRTLPKRDTSRSYQALRRRAAARCRRCQPPVRRAVATVVAKAIRIAFANLRANPNWRTVAAAARRGQPS